MSKLVDKTQLQSVVNGLWTKVKEREVTGGAFIKNTKALTLNKQSGNINVSLNGVVTNWGDLEYIKEYKNLLDLNKAEQGKWYGDVFDRVDGQKKLNVKWSLCDVDVIGDETYYLYRKNGESKIYTFFNGDNFVGKVEKDNNDRDGAWIIHKLDIPEGANKVGIQYQHGMTGEHNIMLVKSDDKIANFNHQVIPIESPLVTIGKEVSIGFNKDNTDLTSDTVETAIKELNTKITNAGTGAVNKVNNVSPTADGNVSLTLDNGLQEVATKLNEYVLKTDAVDTSAGTGSVGKVVKLGANGLISTTMIPKIAITEVKKLTDKPTALQEATNGAIQNGDVVIITNESNKIYMLADSSNGSTFDDKFIELSLGDGTIKSIGGQTTTNGNIALEFATGADEYELKANGIKVAGIPTMTDLQKSEIIAVLNS